jgi:Peptidase M15
MLRLVLLAGVFAGVLSSSGTFAPASAEFRFSSQRSLTKPDPFLKRKKKPKQAQVEFIFASLAPQNIAPSLVHKASLGPDVNALDPPLIWGKFDPRLSAFLAKIETHFGAKVIISSGCRTRAHNTRVGGARNSYHMKCMAADISIAGVAPQRIRDFAMALPERGGVGTYCSTPIVHVDVGPKRQWYWGCGYRSSGSAHFDLN